MEIIRTDQYPIRYVAHDNPGKWVEHFRPQDRGGFEFACYSLPIVNEYWPNLTDGIAISVYSYQGKKLVLDCFLGMPDQSRRQVVKRFDVASAPQAEILARDWLREIWPLIARFIPDIPMP
jgi:hypothetical protein